MDRNGAFPEWVEDVKEWWNKNVYGEETEVKTGYESGNGLVGLYYKSETTTSEKSEKYKGNYIVKTTTIDSTGNDFDTGYTFNLLSSYDWGNNEKTGVSFKEGISMGKGGLNFSQSQGIDILKFNLNIDTNIGFGGDELLNIGAKIKFGWGNKNIGIGSNIPMSPFENIKLFCFTNHVQGNTNYYNEAGIYLKMGLVYAVVMVMYMAYYGFQTGDFQGALQQFLNYIESLKNNCIG